MQIVRAGYAVPRQIKPALRQLLGKFGRLCAVPHSEVVYLAIPSDTTGEALSWVPDDAPAWSSVLLAGVRFDAAPIQPLEDIGRKVPRWCGTLFPAATFNGWVPGGITARLKLPPERVLHADDRLHRGTAGLRNVNKHGRDERASFVDIRKGHADI